MRSTTLVVNGIDHVVLHVSDLERSKAFYIDVLGFELRNESNRPDQKMAFLRCGGQGLDLFQSDADVHGGQEMNHMALRLAESDLGQILAELAKVEVDASEPSRRGTVFISDPDGHQIEMLPARTDDRVRDRVSTATQ